LLATEAMPETRLHFCHFPAVFQWWAVDESRIMAFEYYSTASKYTPVSW